MLYNCLEWYKWVLTNFYHDRQLYNTLIPPLHESPAVGLRISRLSGSVELTLRYTTPDIHCRHRRHECDGGIKYHRLSLSITWSIKLLVRVQEHYIAYNSYNSIMNAEKYFSVLLRTQLTVQTRLAWTCLFGSSIRALCQFRFSSVWNEQYYYTKLILCNNFTKWFSQRRSVLTSRHRVARQNSRSYCNNQQATTTTAFAVLAMCLCLS